MKFPRYGKIQVMSQSPPSRKNGCHQIYSASWATPRRVSPQMWSLTERLRWRCEPPPSTFFDGKKRVKDQDFLGKPDTTEINIFPWMFFEETQTMKKPQTDPGTWRICLEKIILRNVPTTGKEPLVIFCSGAQRTSLGDSRCIIQWIWKTFPLDKLSMIFIFFLFWESFRRFSLGCTPI